MHSHFRVQRFPEACHAHPPPVKESTEDALVDWLQRSLTLGQCREEDRLTKKAVGAAEGPGTALRWPRHLPPVTSPQIKHQTRRFQHSCLPCRVLRAQVSRPPGAFADGRRATPPPPPSCLGCAKYKGSFHPGILTTLQLHVLRSRSRCPHQASAHGGQTFNSRERD